MSYGKRHVATAKLSTIHSRCDSSARISFTSSTIHTCPLTLTHTGIAHDATGTRCDDDAMFNLKRIQENLIIYFSQAKRSVEFPACTLHAARSGALKICATQGDGNESNGWKDVAKIVCGWTENMHVKNFFGHAKLVIELLLLLFL